MGGYGPNKHLVTGFDEVYPTLSRTVVHINLSPGRQSLNATYIVLAFAAVVIAISSLYLRSTDKNITDNSITNGGTTGLPMSLASIYKRSLLSYLLFGLTLLVYILRASSLTMCKWSVCIFMGKTLLAFIFLILVFLTLRAETDESLVSVVSLWSVSFTFLVGSGARFDTILDFDELGLILEGVRQGISLDWCLLRCDWASLLATLCLLIVQLIIAGLLLGLISIPYRGGTYSIRPHGRKLPKSKRTVVILSLQFNSVFVVCTLLVIQYII